MRSDGVRVKKDRADRKKKAKTWMWSDVVKGLLTDSVKMFDLEELNQLKAKADEKSTEVNTDESNH